MGKPSKTQAQQQQPTIDTHHRENDEEVGEYKEMEWLERLETLREDMEELGVTTLAEVIERIEVLHQRLDRK